MKHRFSVARVATDASDVWFGGALAVAFGLSFTGCATHGPADSLRGSTATLKCPGDDGDAAADAAVAGPPPGTMYTLFVAIASDFQGYHCWPHFAGNLEAGAGGGTHTGSSFVEYINWLPLHGTTTFPVGTLIVKDMPNAAGGAPQVFAMVKRGNFNLTGAAGWEWFELVNRSDGSDSVIIKWQGVGPPIGETYGGDPNSGCNTCHGAASATNDSVLGAALQLANF